MKGVNCCSVQCCCSASTDNGLDEGGHWRGVNGPCTNIDETEFGAFCGGDGAEVDGDKMTGRELTLVHRNQFSALRE